MTKLETLYASIKGLEKVGLTLTDEMLKKADELEEQLIKTEVLPTLSKDIEPRLSQIQRELVLVVEYKPGEPISVALSRKTNIAELLEAKRLEPDPPVEHKVNNTPRKKKQDIAPRTAIKVTMPDGTVLQENNAAMTLVETIRRIGVERVRQVCEQSEGKLLRPNKVLLVSNTIDKNMKHRKSPFIVMVLNGM